MKKLYLAVIIGNILEWLDFSLYSSLTLTIGLNFFPASSQYHSLLLTYLIFAIGFIFRPLGGILFGHIGDLYGRKSALLTSMIFMIISSLVIGFLPTYSQIGWLATILLILGRFFQGISLGGEGGGSISFLFEHAKPHNQGLTAGIAFIGNGIGTVLGMIIIIVVSNSLTSVQFIDWGWRICFLLAIPLAIFGYYLRSFLYETPEFLAIKSSRVKIHIPIIELFTNYKKEIILGIVTCIPLLTMMYILISYLYGFRVSTLHASTNFTSLTIIFSIFCHLLVLYYTAYLSDRFGVKKILMIAIAIGVITIYPIFYLICVAKGVLPIIGICLFGVLAAIYCAPAPAFISLIFPVKVRFTGVAFVLNIASAICGFVPSIAHWLVHITAFDESVALYIIVVSLIGLLSLYFSKIKAA